MNFFLYFNAEVVEKEQISPHIVKIVRKHDPIPEMVDSTNVLVQQVIQAGYTEEESIEAVRITKAKDVASAVRYLQDQEETEDSGVILPSIQSSYRQDSSDYFNERDR